MPSFDPPLIPPRLRFLEGRSTVISASWVHHTCSPFWRIYRNKDPGAWIDHPRGHLELQPGVFYLLPAWGGFRSGCTGRIRHLFLHVEVVGLDGEWAAGALSLPQVLPQDDHLSDLAKRAEAMSDWWWATALTHAAFAVWTRSLSDDRRVRLAEHVAGSDPLAPALDLVERHLDELLPVSALARACGISTDTLTRSMRRRTGRNPADWIRRRRCARAAELLAGSSLSIAAIAAQCGFANRDHFSRVFARMFGCGPAEHRRAARSWQA